MDIVRLRYVGPDRVRVPKLGKVVEPDELVGVPADVFKQYGWPETLWQREGADAPPAAAPDEQTPPAADAGADTTTTTSRKARSDA